MWYIARDDGAGKTAPGERECYEASRGGRDGISEIGTTSDIVHSYDTGRICCAESDDGFHWRKPDLGIVEYRGSTHNNICDHRARHRVHGRAVPARRAAGAALPDGHRVHRVAAPQEAAAAGDALDHPLRRQPGRLPVDDAAGGAGRRRPTPRGVLPVPVPGSLPHRRSPGITTAVPAFAASPRPAVLRPAHHGGLAVAGRGSLAAGDLPRLLQADAVLLARTGPAGTARRCTWEPT